jgi:hypothetical protein
VSSGCLFDSMFYNTKNFNQNLNAWNKLLEGKICNGTQPSTRNMFVHSNCQTTVDPYPGPDPSYSFAGPFCQYNKDSNIKACTRNAFRQAGCSCKRVAKGLACMNQASRPECLRQYYLKGNQTESFAQKLSLAYNLECAGVDPGLLNKKEG